MLAAMRPACDGGHLANNLLFGCVVGSAFPSLTSFDDPQSSVVPCFPFFHSGFSFPANHSSPLSSEHKQEMETRRKAAAKRGRGKEVAEDPVEVLDSQPQPAQAAAAGA